MIIAQLMFYVFACLLVASCIAVIFARHPVHAVLFLILAFFNCAGLFLLLGAEFVAMILIVVYVGAVAVFFLFVVMMLDVDFASLRSRWVSYAPLGGLVAFILLFEISFFAFYWEGPVISQATNTNNNVKDISVLLYDDYSAAFLISSLILFSAMVGAIVLTLRTRTAKKQNYAEQNARSNTVDMVNIKKEAGA